MDGWGEAGIIIGAIGTAATVVGVAFTVWSGRRTVDPATGGATSFATGGPPLLGITSVDHPGGSMSHGPDATFMFPVHVVNLGYRTAGLSVVMYGGEVELARSAPFSIGGDAGEALFLNVKRAPIRWRTEFSGWDYTGQGELAVEVQNPNGATLARFVMPSGEAT